MQYLPAIANAVKCIFGAKRRPFRSIKRLMLGLVGGHLYGEPVTRTAYTVTDGSHCAIRTSAQSPCHTYIRCPFHPIESAVQEVIFHCEYNIYYDIGIVT